ncbi:2992_t:CDS:2 [Entrophospora sp. SA101]|nr:2992_t:CDS:2 [Entrophospora sp. SA101]CAJ0824412.1 8051_t:CDS:2 [Entrophospora sp. SA101]CAJ0880207.1 4113_t:CDS:2 [Entrophospora sp. SA101]
MLKNYNITRNFQIYQIFVFYLKPVQTGYPVDSDSRLLETFISSSSSRRFRSKSLFKYEKPVSPHIAVTDKSEIPNDERLLLEIKNFISESSKEETNDNSNGILFLETAGGVNSPIMSGTLQSEFYRSLRLPTILIGDGNLGGISTTISSFESLYLHGYDIPLILLFEDTKYENDKFLTKYFDKNFPDLKIIKIRKPPEKHPDQFQDIKQLTKYFSNVDNEFANTVEYLNSWHNKKFDKLEEMKSKAKEIVWWPFTQHQLVDNVTLIDSAYKDSFTTYDGNKMNELFDGSASWWTQGVGHGSSKLSLVASHSAGRYGHVLFPECINETALNLSETLLNTTGKDWAKKVFFSDNGSTAMEVALKMALRSTIKKYHNDNPNLDLKILGLDGSYHGDTIGVMNSSSYWINPPRILMKNNEYHILIPSSFTETTKFNNSNTIKYTSLSSLFSDERLISDPISYFYTNYIKKYLTNLVIHNNVKFGALLIEPIVMGAGGMMFVDPLFQKCLINFIRNWDYWKIGVDGGGRRDDDNNDWKGIPIVFDEVFTGFWRLGYKSASYAKLLTGGLLPMAVTLAKSSIFDSFLGDSKVDALLHGHSFTAHPIGCATVEKISCLPTVEGTFALGTLLSIELKDKESGYASNIASSIIQKLRKTNNDDNDDSLLIFSRPLGNVIYFISSLTTDLETIKKVENKILNCLTI